MEGVVLTGTTTEFILVAINAAATLFFQHAASWKKMLAGSATGWNLLLEGAPEFAFPTTCMHVYHVPGMTVYTQMKYRLLLLYAVERFETHNSMDGWALCSGLK